MAASPPTHAELTDLVIRFTDAFNRELDALAVSVSEPHDVVTVDVRGDRVTIEISGPAATGVTTGVDNLAVRADYYRAHPWRAPSHGKKGGAAFLREVECSGKRWLRAPDARVLHAPHSSAGFFVARGWRAGLDQDWVVRQRGDSTRLARVDSAQYALDPSRVADRLAQLELRLLAAKPQVIGFLLQGTVEPGG